jgi:hypothetical protein
MATGETGREGINNNKSIHQIVRCRSYEYRNQECMTMKFKFKTTSLQGHMIEKLNKTRKGNQRQSSTPRAKTAEQNFYLYLPLPIISR